MVEATVGADSGVFSMKGLSCVMVREELFPARVRYVCRIRERERGGRGHDSLGRDCENLFPW